MRIAILTFRLRYNYGGILQAYALHKYLQALGHQVSILTQDTNPPITCRLAFLSVPKRIIGRMFGQSVNVFYEFKERIVGRHLRHFILRNFNIDDRDYASIKPADYDAIVVGGDQIWRPKYLGGMQPELKDVFLDFTKGWDIKRVAYSVSLGVDNWEYNKSQTEYAREMIAAFNGISFREDSGTRLCRDYLGVDAIHLLDPTLLLCKEDYLRLIPQNRSVEKKDIFCYVLDEDDAKNAIIEYLSQIHHYSVRRFCQRPDDRSLPLKDRIQRPIWEWISALDNSEMVVTDSFHGCVFSIIFNKPFVVIGNPERGLARIESLLQQFNLGESMEDLEKSTGLFIKYCDPNSSSVCLEDLQKRSFDFLTENLR